MYKRQPLHCFDADKIKGGKIVVKTVAEGTTFVTLDEVERKLSDKDPVSYTHLICFCRI